MKKFLSLLAFAAIVNGAQKAQCQSLYVNNGFCVSPGAIVAVPAGLQTGVLGTVTNKGTITVSGSLTNNGSMPESGAGTYIIKGNGAATSIDGTNSIPFYDVQFDNVNGFTATTPLSIKHLVTFSNGIINYNAASPFSFLNGSSWVGVSNNSHIKGGVSKEGLGTFIFPVGDGSKTKRVAVDSIDLSSGSIITFTANYHIAPLPDAGNITAPLGQLSNKEYWTVSCNSESTASLSFEYDPADYDAAFAGDTGVMRLAYDESQNWVEKGMYSRSFFANGIRTNPLVSNWGDFTIARTRGIIIGGQLKNTQPVTGTNAVQLKPLAAGLKMWPNPAPGYFYVQSQQSKPLPVYIFDATGKMLRQMVLQPGQQQRVSQLIPGTYFVKGDNTALKVIVQ